MYAKTPASVSAVELTLNVHEPREIGPEAFGSSFDGRRPVFYPKPLFVDYDARNLNAKTCSHASKAPLV